MALARFERDFTDEAGNLLTGNVSVQVRRMTGGMPQLYSDREGASALGNPFINDGGRVAFHAAGSAYRVTVTQGAFSRELTYVALGLAAETDFTFAQNQGVYSAVVTYARGDYVVRNGVGIFISTQNGNLNHTPDSTTPGSTAYWTYYPGLQGPPGEAGPVGAGVDWLGAWSAGSYDQYDAVEHNGSSYVANTTTTEEPPHADWDLLAAEGAAGAPGATGAEGPQGDSGLIGEWLGPWMTATSYALLDAVQEGGSSYMCIEAHTSGTFATDLAADKWELVAAKGDQGVQGETGAQGDQGIQGDEGPQGIQGIQGDPGADGVSFIWLGAYDNGTTYDENDVVEDAGSSWVALQSTTGNAPPALPTTSNAYWELMAAKGADGEGAGSVTSVALAAPTGFDVSGSPVTVSGTLTLAWTAGYQGFTTAEATKLGHITVTQAVDLDAVEAAAAASKVKTDFLTVTQAVDLDAIETRVNALDAAVILKGVWDASAGTFPGSGTAQAGESWIVSVAGTVNSVAFAVGDRIIAITDNASTSTFAANWFKADYTDQVLTVAGKTGTVTLDKSDVGLGNVDNTSNATERAATATLTNKTLVDPAITGTILEDIYTITDGAGFQIDPGNGSIQQITLTASRTPAATNFANGEGILLMVNDGTAYTITWTTVGVVWLGGSAPTLATAGWTHIVLYKVGGTIYGKHVGNSA